MANICITGICNRACAYCFAGMNVAEHRSEVPYMEWATYVRCLDYAQRSGMDHVRLLGGEPTLHPRFNEMVAEALGRQLTVRVFSNGLMPERALGYLERIPAGKVIVLLNVNLRPDGEPDVAGQERTMQRLGPALTLGLNISHPRHCRPYVLLNLIDRFGMAPTMRVGIAHPRVGGSNLALHPRYYAKVGRELAAFMTEASSRGITVGLDCGFVPCMFPEEAQELLKAQHFGATPCNPILDILPTGEVIACYPLEGLGRVMLTDAMDARGIREAFEGQLSQIRQILLFPECEECAARQARVCHGGCLAASMRRLRGRETMPAESLVFPMVTRHNGTPAGTNGTKASPESKPMGAKV